MERLFPISESRAASGLAIDAWVDCLRERQENTVKCSEWQEKDIKYSLNRVSVSAERYVPVIESTKHNQFNSGRVIIHLTGGTDSTPYLAYDDKRRGIYEFLQDRGYMVASIGYWGTNVRTTMQNGEIARATQDLKDAIEYYSRKCECRPIVIAESLGAAVTFNYINGGGYLPSFAVYLAPVMGGLEEANSIFWKEKKLGLTLTIATTRIYKIDGSGVEEEFEERMVDAAVHLSRFMIGGKTSAPQEALESKCYTFFIGERDRLNESFKERNLKSVYIVSNKEHDIIDDDYGDVAKAIYESFRCHGVKI